jgi:hypothetical protein
MFSRKLLRNQTHSFWVDILVLEIEYGDSKLETEDCDQGFACNDALGHQVVQQAAALFIAIGASLSELVVRNEPSFDQYLAYTLLE